MNFDFEISRVDLCLILLFPHFQILTADCCQLIWLILTFFSATNLSEESAIKTTWHFNVEDQDIAMRDPPTETAFRRNKAVLEGLQLVSSAAKRVWEELYVCKKPVSFITGFVTFRLEC